MNVLKIRGHHLKVADIVLSKSREYLAELLIREKYIDSKDDSFVNIIYNTIIGIFENPENKLEIIANEEDFICGACPIGGSYPECPENLSRTIERKDIDEKRVVESIANMDFVGAKKYGLEVGKTYSSEDVRIQFQNTVA